MGVIINIDEALKLRTDYNVLKEPLNDMIVKQQEEFERENPIDMLFVRNSISSFQETYTSSIGFSHAFSETSDYAVGPIFNTAEGFSATYRTRTFQGGFIITQQALEDRQYGRIKDDASQFVTRWHGDLVEYAMKNMDAGFGTDDVYYTVEDEKGVIRRSKLKLQSADTTDGSIDGTKNPLFCKEHNIVRREEMTNDTFNRGKQSNYYYGDIDIMGDDPGKIAKLADLINQVITNMENYKDDNGKYAGVRGEKTIVIANDPHLKAALKAALSMTEFKQGESMFPNPAYERATVKYTPYLNDIRACAIDRDNMPNVDTAKSTSCGFFIVDKSYMARNHGLEFTERVPFTLEVFNHREAPQGIKYEGRQRFDINVATWRGIAYVYIGTPETTDTTAWNYSGKMTTLTLSDTIVKPVKVVNETEVKVTNTTAIDVDATITNTSENPVPTQEVVSG